MASRVLWLGLIWQGFFKFKINVTTFRTNKSQAVVKVIFSFSNGRFSEPL